METREPMPPALMARIREVGALCILAGCTTEETLVALEREAKAHGYGIKRRP